MKISCLTVNERSPIIKGEEIPKQGREDREGWIWFKTRFPLKTCGNDKQWGFSDEESGT